MPVALPSLARMQWRDAKVVHCLLPAWEAGELESISDPSSVGIAFSAQQGAVVRRAGSAKARDLDVMPSSVGLCGAEPLHWIRTPASSDTVEITASAALRAEIAHALRVPAHADLGDVMAERDAVTLAIALRFRAACRGWLPLADVERDHLVRTLYAHVLRRYFGGRGAAARATMLGAPRLQRVTDFVMAHLGGDLSIARLAAECAMSGFHFAHAFKAATGLPPHRFVTLLRLKAAEDRLRAGGTTVEAVARSVGFENLSHFRRAFRAQVGCLPCAI